MDQAGPASAATTPMDVDPTGKRGADAALAGAVKRVKSGPGVVATKSDATATTFDKELEEVAELLEVSKRLRPPPPDINAHRDALVFQQIEIDQQVRQHPLPGMPGPSRGPVSELRMYGVTEAGNSVLAHVHGFVPYFYAQVPSSVAPDGAFCERFRMALNHALSGHEVAKKLNCSEFVLGVNVERRQSLWGYQGARQSLFLRVTTVLPKVVSSARNLLEAGIAMPGGGSISMKTYESDIPFVMRFMIDTNVVGGNWIELPAGRYRVTPEAERVGHCQIEVDVAFDAFISHAPEGQWSKIAPLRILSFDIECAGRRGVFPEAEIDPVINIANYITVQGDSHPCVRSVFCLRSCSSIVGSEVHTFEREADMLAAWRDFVIEMDPDMITGYNITNFDIPYLLTRAQTLKIGKFALLGRIRTEAATMRKSTFSSKAYGTRENKITTIDGRVQFDMLTMIQRDHKLSSYTLNSVSAHFLSEQKEDVQHSIITDLWNGNADTRRRLAVYCLKDAYLPQRLLDKLMAVYNYMEMARVTGVPISFLLTRGQQVKVVSQLYRKARQRGMVIPYVPTQGSEEKYEGAIVIEPRKGYYTVPIATLDFSSLYPSIMMAHNLCYSTLLPRAEAEKMPAEDVVRTPTGDCFVKPHVKKGVLPEILEELLAARARAKEDLKKATDPFVKAVLDGRQLALKISANSVYGFTGATVGKLPCLEISSSVTAFGREMIEKTKELVEQRYTIRNGYQHDALVVYGDTDSVMVNFGVATVKEAMELGSDAAKFVTTHFIAPIKLLFEKVYYPYLLISKKRYAGLYWSNPNKHSHMDTKGIETVRRDNCLLVRKVIATCLNKILLEQDIDGAVAYCKEVISDLLQNRMDLSMLVISKQLSKTEYDNKQPHVELAARMRQRDAGSAPVLGDRVPYVMIQGTKGQKGYELAEDPLYVLEHNVRVDFQYYLEHQLSKPLLRIFGPILDNPKSLLSGDHTRAIAKPTLSSGALMRFTVRTLSCLHCKAPLKDGERTVCGHCRDREGEAYQKAVAKVAHFEDLYARAWTQCQRCQGSLHQDVLCTSRDCPIFYMRKKVQKDLTDAQETLARFDVSW